MKNKSIVFIPPNGELVAQDFALFRIINYLAELNIKTYLLVVNELNDSKLHYETNIIAFNSRQEIISHLENNKYNLIFHRTWMHRYPFAAEIANKFDNAIIYIKDWQNLPEDKYGHVYSTQDDCEAIKSIFNSNATLLSHYKHSYMKKLSKQYNSPNSKLIFFPEYCNKNLFIQKNKSVKKKMKILFASGLNSSSQAIETSPGKSVFNLMYTISKQNIRIDLMLLPKAYTKLNANDKLYEDYLYEDKFNPFFNIKKGSELNHNDTLKYHFGIFAGLDMNVEGLYLEAESNAITSKLSFYLESGLPILVNKKFKFLSKLVEKNSIGLIYEDKNLKDLNSLINITKKEYSDLLQNVNIFRKKFIYNQKTMKPILKLLGKGFK